MTTAADISKSQSTEPAINRRVPQRTYVFVVTALAVFFAGLVIWRVPVSSYIVTARIGWESPSVDTAMDSNSAIDPAKELLNELTDRELLRDAVNMANSQSPTPVFASGSVLRQSDLELLTKQLGAQVRQSSGESKTIELKMESPHSDWAIAFLNQLARQAIRPAVSSSGHRLSSSRQLRDARWKLDEARHYHRRAQYELQNFVDDHFEQVTGIPLGTGKVSDRTIEQDAAHAPPSGGDFIAVEQEPDETEQADPKRDRLEKEIIEVRLRRARLLRQFTENHPQVRDLTLQLDDLHARLDALSPAVRKNTAESRTSPFPVVDGVSSENFSEGQGGSQQFATRINEADIATYLTLRSSEHSAAEALEKAQQDFEDRLHLITAARTEVEVADARWILAPATVVGHRGGNLPPARVLLIGLASMACGMIMAWLAGSIRAVLRVNSISDVQAITRLPIVGQLSIDPATADANRLANRQRVVRWGTLGCELTLGLLALTFIATVMASSPTISQFADDPFGVFAETIVQACRARL